MNEIKLYRYLPDEAAIKTIESRSFRVSRLTDLNDPFEWRFGFEGCPPELEPLINNSVDGYIELASHDQGIISFSGKLKDPILWSLYANHHRGVAFEIIGKKISEAGDGITFEVNEHRHENLFEVEYDKPRIVLPFQTFHQIPDQEKLEKMKDFFKRKSESWRYEKEFRWVIGLEACIPYGGRFFWKIPPGLIARVIIGFRSSTSELYVRRALNLNGFQDIKIARAQLSQTSYEVEVPEPV